MRIYSGHAGITLSQKWGVLEKTRHLVEEEQRDQDDHVNIFTSSEDCDNHDEVENEAMIKRNWRASNLTMSTGRLPEHLPNNVGQIIVVRRNTSNGMGRRPRPRLLADGILSVDSYKKYFGINFTAAQW
ncbi:hypothetical protein NHQ30_002106 [Ciborinia camelliae]|nr:hypothetical protein NHQ30_002106 [Ciborinia camelliae]